ncbi:DUF423 domain-containing protein [Piscibacillus salipiscarius]|uniref:DUF423 domain-containing protein n=1 Tax=Piscibacillus salipiscarius TaxID=299480 RepID=A0ABW5Q6A5_9BACI
MKALLLIGVINGFLAVALGAFGAHGLESKLSEKMMSTWEKAVQYQMFHTLAIFIAGMMMLRFDHSMLASAGWTFLLGIILFSGSLYIYSLSGIKTFAMITPIGGVAFLVGWVLLGISIMKVVG